MLIFERCISVQNLWISENAENDSLLGKLGFDTAEKEPLKVGGESLTFIMRNLNRSRAT